MIMIQTIVVDDDPNTAEQIASLLQERKAQVHAFTNYLSFMEAVGALVQDEMDYRSPPEEKILFYVQDLLLERIAPLLIHRSGY